MLKYLLAAALLLATPSLRAAELDGVSMPDTVEVGGTRLVLNGMAVRTYSILHVHIYVTGLYLERRSANAEEILNSDGTKLVQFSFLRDVSAEDARKSWREGLAQNCRAPCRLAPNDVEQFIAAIPGVKRGDTSTMVFTRRGLEITLNGRSMGRIADPNFVRVIMSTFIGPNTAVPEVRSGLLGQPR
ncbi:chalcone isomerase family protein [Roseomonas sp. BN140053]|uniref:chalcone isomerase family protein n=1 Tax=Roseomonas sp. BN140053 TaxID=3391898 RepID=UPI0039ED2ECA